MSLSSTTKDRIWAYGLGSVLLLSALIFSPSLRGRPVWDDHYLYVGQQGIGGGKSLLACFTHPFLSFYFRPLVSVSFYIEHFLWRTNPFGYHQTNILLHLIGTGLTIALLRAMFNRRSIALLGGLFYAVQPLHASTTAWIGGRTDEMGTVFILVCLWALVKGLTTDNPRHVRRWITASVIFYTIALLSKEQLLALIIPIPIAAYVFKKEKRPTRSEVFRLTLPYVIVSILFVICYALVAKASARDFRDTFSDIVMEGGESVLHYAQLLVYPTTIALHSFTFSRFRGLNVPAAILGYLILAGWVALTVISWKTDRRVSWLAIIVGLIVLPVCNFIPVPSLLAGPYRVTSAQFAAGGLMAVAFVSLWDRWKFWIPQIALLGTLCILVLTWSVLSFRENRVWSSDFNLFGTVAHDDPGCLVARVNYAGALLNKHQYAAEVTELSSALAYIFHPYPGEPIGQAVLRKIHNPRIIREIRRNYSHRGSVDYLVSELVLRIGDGYLMSNLPQYALSNFQYAARIDPKDPSAWVGIGRAQGELNLPLDAVTSLNRAYRLDPKNPETVMVLARACIRAGNLPEAIQMFQWATHLIPWVGTTWLDLAAARLSFGDAMGAKSAIDSALKRAPERADVIAEAIIIYRDYLHDKTEADILERKLQSAQISGGG